MRPTDQSLRKESCLRPEEIFDKTTKTVVDDRGRIYIPRDMRRKLGIKEGDKLFIFLINDYLEIYTRKAFKREVERQHFTER